MIKTPQNKFQTTKKAKAWSKYLRCYGIKSWNGQTDNWSYHFKNNPLDCGHTGCKCHRHYWRYESPDRYRDCYDLLPQHKPITLTELTRYTLSDLIKY